MGTPLIRFIFAVLFTAVLIGCGKMSADSVRDKDQQRIETARSARASVSSLFIMVRRRCACGRDGSACSRPRMRGDGDYDPCPPHFLVLVL